MHVTFGMSVYCPQVHKDFLFLCNETKISSELMVLWFFTGTITLAKVTEASAVHYIMCFSKKSRT